MSFTSDEVNTLIHRYLIDSGFEHSAYVFANESRVLDADIDMASVLPGTLVSLLQKGLLYAEVEHSVNPDGTVEEIEAPLSLLTPHIVPRKDIKKRPRSSDDMEIDDKTKISRTEGKNSVKLANSISIAPSKACTLEGHTDEVFSLSWNPKFNLLATGSNDGTAKLWDLGIGATNKKRGEEISRKHITLNHRVDPNQSSGNDGVITVEWDNEGSTLATGCHDGTVRLWDTNGNLIKALEPQGGAVFSLRWSRGGSYLVSALVERKNILYSAKNNYNIVHTYAHHQSASIDVDWASDNLFASCSSDKTIALCEVGSVVPVRILRGHTDEVNVVRWNKSGDLLASGSDDQTARLWRFDSTAPVHTFSEHKDKIYHVAFNPVQPMLATASFDATVILWDTVTGTEKMKLIGHEENVFVASFSPDGRYVATGSVDKNVYIWSVSDGKKVRSFKGTGGVFEIDWNPAGDRLAVSFSSRVAVVMDPKL